MKATGKDKPAAATPAQLQTAGMQHVEPPRNDVALLQFAAGNRAVQRWAEHTRSSERPGGASGTDKPAQRKRLQSTVEQLSGPALQAKASSAHGSVTPEQTFGVTGKNRGSSQHPAASIAASASSGAQPVIQRKYNFNSQVYDKSAYEAKDFETEDLDHGKFSSVEADRGLPTFYGVLKKEFGGALNDDFFDKTKKELGDSCDRPHKVTAAIKKTSKKKGRKGAAFVTAIGNLGNEELLLRDGYDSDSVSKFDGGHLVGYQVLGGDEADQQWNVAPQEYENNEHAFNPTIENMLRTAKVGSEISYEVSVSYRSLNFAVSQQQLVDSKALNNYVEDGPWEIQLPARIPYNWSAVAAIENDEGSFGDPIKDPKGAFEQHSQNEDPDENKLMHNDTAYTARYRMNFFNDKDEQLDYFQYGQDEKELKTDFETEDIRKVDYYMHQVQPANFAAKGSAPKDWKGKLSTDYGEVALTKDVTFESVKSLYEEIKGTVNAYNELKEESDDEQMDLSDLIVEQTGSLNEEQTIQTLYELTDKHQNRAWYDSMNSLYWFGNEYNSLIQTKKQDDSLIEDTNTLLTSLQDVVFGDKEPQKDIMTNAFTSLGKVKTRVRVAKNNKERRSANREKKPTLKRTFEQAFSEAKEGVETKRVKLNRRKIDTVRKVYSKTTKQEIANFFIDLNFNK